MKSMRCEFNVLEKLKNNKRVTVVELDELSRPIWNALNINPRYGTKIDVELLTTKALKKIYGVPESYSGWSMRKDFNPNVECDTILINKQCFGNTILRTLAHETAHVVLNDATRAVVDKRNAERKAIAMERVFMDALGNHHDITFHGIWKPRDTDTQLIQDVRDEYKAENPPNQR